jgi:hypothetical protein
MTAGVRAGRTARRVSASLGVLALLLAYTMLTGGIALLWSDTVDREAGYVWGPPISGVTDSHAVISDDIHLDTTGVQAALDQVVATVRLEVTPTDPTDVLFVGVGRSADVADYLRGVPHRQAGDLGQGGEARHWLGSGVTTDRAAGSRPSPRTSGQKIPSIEFQSVPIRTRGSQPPWPLPG